MTSLFKSKYHISVMTFYVFVCIYFFFFTKSPLSYFLFQRSDFNYFFPIIIISFPIFLLINKFLKFGDTGINRMSFLKLY